MKHILAIEDDRELCELLEAFLNTEGFVLEMAYNGREGLIKARERQYDLLLLDVMLPGMNGFELLRELRKTSTVPVIMLTARGDEVDRVVGLEMGADDYLPKPFSTRELIARIRAILRRGEPGRGGSSAPEATLQLGDITLDPGSHEVTLSGKPVHLTHVEYLLLEALLRSAGRTVSRETLVRDVLERSYSPWDRSIDVHASNLRKKLGLLPDGGERIKTIRGTGYLYPLLRKPEKGN
ncbi:MAG: response regulator transcription factor [Thermovirgaceae bacterium]|nr:response regulator transcription factor [Thermovirgaceae bacterium]